MGGRLKSFFSNITTKKLGFGVKVNLLVYVILIISFSVISIVGLQLFKKHIHQVSYEKLEQITYQKKNIVEGEYRQFLKEVDELFSEDLMYSLQNLATAFNDYESEMYNYFYPDSLEQTKILLADYYESEILANIEWNTPELLDVMPESDKSLVFQNIYIRNNKWASGEKDKLFNPKTGASYDTYHEFLHPKIRSFARKNNVNNVYFIDAESGDVFYNLNKNIAFSTNLFSGKFKSTELSKIFQQTLSSTAKNSQLYFSDFTPFVAEGYKSVAYLAKALILYNEIVAISVIELSPEFLEEMINDVWLEQNWDKIAVNILSNDGKFRLNELEQYMQPAEYFSNLKEKGITDDLFMKAAQIGSAANVLGVNFSESKVSGLDVSTDFKGDEFLYLSQPLNLNGIDWSIYGAVPLKANSANIASVRNRVILVFLLLFVFSSFFLRKFISSVVLRLRLLSGAFEKLAEGEKIEKLKSSSQDELGYTMKVFNKLNKRIDNVGELAIELSNGNYDKKFKAASDNDYLANALNQLGDGLKSNDERLKAREAEDKKNTWVNEGIAKFNDLLRQSNNDIKELAYIVIENMVSYLNMVQGGVFLVDGESESTKKINLIAGFAFDRRKHNQKEIEIGEGLIGNCYLERKSIHLRNIPDDYLELSSGLGSAKPKTLYIVPLINDNAVLGFIEMASLNILEEHQVDFIEKLAENIAATFATVKLNTKTAELLEESERRANEITQQEEEMRQNMEEMLATQEELARIREDDEKRSSELQTKIEYTSGILQNILNAIKGEVIVKDSHGVIVFANAQASERYGLTEEGMKGKPDANVLDKTILESEQELDASTLNEGGYIGYRTENVNGALVEYVIEKKPFSFGDDSEPGIITFWLKGDKTD